MKVKAHKRQLRQTGSVVVEMAVVVPLLILVLLSVAETGRAMYQYNQLLLAVRNGARYFAISADPGPADFAGAQNLVVYGNVGGLGRPILPDFNPDDVTPALVGADYVSIDASYSFAFLWGNPLAAIRKIYGVGSIPLTLNASITMQIAAP
jgi:hypothetical protein